MYKRILFSALLLAGMSTAASAQSNETSQTKGELSPLKSATIIIGKLNPKLVGATSSPTAPYTLGLDVTSTRAVLPSVIRTGTKWTEHGKNNPKAVNYETVDYAQLVPVLVAAMQDQQAQIAELKEQIAALKRETASR